MGYRFGLAQVLRLRVLATDEEERTLTRIHQEIAQLKAGVSRAETDLEDTAAVRQRSFAQSALPAMHLHASYAATQAARERAAQLKEQLVRFEDLRTQQVAKYSDAYRKRETLAGLAKAHRAAWDERSERMETRTIEDAFLAKWLRTRAEL
jgi:hypothetical protein